MKEERARRVRNFRCIDSFARGWLLFGFLSKQALSSAVYSYIFYKKNQYLLIYQKPETKPRGGMLMPAAYRFR